MHREDIYGRVGAPAEELASLMLTKWENEKLDSTKLVALTDELFKLGNIRKVIKAHPELDEQDIRDHIKSTHRCPPKVKNMHNEAIICFDPQLSGYISIFATDHYHYEVPLENDNPDEEDYAGPYRIQDRTQLGSEDDIAALCLALAKAIRDSPKLTSRLNAIVTLEDDDDE